MQNLARNKPAFLVFSGLSVACLVGAFANPLQKIEVWRQEERGAFNLPYQKNFIITEGDKYYPYGFDSQRAVKIESIYEDYKVEKIGALIMAVSLALTAIRLGKETCIGDEIDTEVQEIQAQGKKQLILEAIKHRLAMTSKSQRLLFMEEMRELISEFGSIEGEILKSDEANATDKFTNASYLLAEGHSLDLAVSQTWGFKAGTPQHTEMKQKFTAWQNDDEDGDGTQSEANTVDFRGVFPESMDGATWKLICRGMAEGLSRTEIISDVLECSGSQSHIGEAYLDYLKKKFLGADKL